MGKAIPFAEILAIQTMQAKWLPMTKRASLCIAGRWWRKAIGRTRSAPPNAFRPAPAASIYGGTAVWSGDRVRRDPDGLLYFAGRRDFR